MSDKEKLLMLLQARKVSAETELSKAISRRAYDQRDFHNARLLEITYAIDLVTEEL